MHVMELGMKRPNTTDDDDNSDADAQKRARHDASKVRLLLLGRYCGALIGKGGENFKRLRESYGVKITGLSSRANERVLQIEGSTENCLHVVEELLPSCAESRYASNFPDRAPIEINLLANTDAVGMLIGKGGTKMKEIALEAGCRLKVYPKCLPKSNERVVAIGGDTTEVVIKGVSLSLDILNQATPRSPPIFFNPENITESDVLAMDLGNNSRGAGPMNNIGKPPLQHQHHQQQPSIPPPQGNPLDTNIAMMLIAQRELKQHNPVDPKVDFGSVATTTSLTLSNEMCGAIIGKGGQNIKFTRNMSGAKIDFTKNDQSSDDGTLQQQQQQSTKRTITISGTQEQVRIAEELMNQCVRGSESIIRTGGSNHGNMYEQPQQQQQQQQHGMLKPMSIQDSYRQLYDSL